jgi:hypothetical protein
MHFPDDDRVGRNFRAPETDVTVEWRDILSVLSMEVIG